MVYSGAGVVSGWEECRVEASLGVADGGTTASEPPVYVFCRRDRQRNGWEQEAAGHGFVCQRKEEVQQQQGE